MFNNAPRTPLRRGSQRFLAESRPFIASTSSATSQDGASHGHIHGAAGLTALETAFQDIVDSTEMFLQNVQEMDRIAGLFEEAAETMAMFIQAQRMNTFCIEFAQVSGYIFHYKPLIPNERSWSYIVL